MIIPQVVFELLPAGEYDAEISDVEERSGNFGPQLIWTFQLRGAHKGRCLKAYSSAKFSQKAKLYAWVGAVLFAGRPIPRDFKLDTDELIGQRVKLVVTVEEKEDGDFNRVEEVRPPARRVAGNGYGKSEPDDEDLPF